MSLLRRDSKGERKAVNHLSSDRARRMRARLNGRKRAAFWRALGFPNLVLAREALRRKREDQRACRSPESFSATTRRRWEREGGPPPEVGYWLKRENRIVATVPLYVPASWTRRT